MAKASFAFRLDSGLMGEVDRVRGKVSRTAWVEEALRVALALGEASKRAALGPVVPGGQADPVPSVPVPSASAPELRPGRARVAFRVLSSAEAKAGVKPVERVWRAPKS